MSFTNAAENSLLDHIFRGGAGTFTTGTPYIGLLASVSEDSFTELSGNGYARVPVTFGAASNGQISNSAAINFPQATGSWNGGNAIQYFGIFTTGPTGGNLICYGSLSPAKTVSNGDILTIPVGSLVITLD